MSLLDIDPELADCIPAAERANAKCHVEAPTIVVLPKASLTLRPPERPQLLGYLIVDGYLLRRVRVGDVCSVELLGRGDLVQPWLEDSASFCAAELVALSQTRLATLDGNVSAAAQRWQQLQAALLERALLRSRSLSVLNAISHMVGLEQRVMALFWYLAERWGTRIDHHVEIGLPLTHQLIAELVGARRPPVSSALARLSREGALRRDGPIWQLEGEPPAVAACF